MKKLVLLPLLLLLSLLPFSFNAYAADFSCEISHGSLDCTEDRPIDYKAAGQGLRNILRWLNENSTSNTNTQPKSYSGNNTKVYVPPNAYETYYNGKSGFACNGGYTKSGNSCIKNKYIPPNAYASGSSWICKTGYKRSGNSCIRKVAAPANGYASGNSFKCLNGYKKSGNSCVKTVIVPENGYASGNTFECFTGYKKTAFYTCEKSVVIPANAFASGSGWTCKAGYTKSNSSCIKSVEVPENGYAAGYSFLCFNGYKKIGSQCIKEQNEPLEDSGDYLEKIKQAKVLLDSGVITEDEFAEIKKRIIDNI